MKDARVTFWTNPTTHSTGTTANTGPTIDLFNSNAMAGGTSDGTGELHGVGAVILQTNVTGTAQVTEWYWQESSDNSNWFYGAHAGTATLDVASEVVRLKTSFQTTKRYVRLYASNTGTGTSTSKVYPEDYGSVKSGGLSFA